MSVFVNKSRLLDVLMKEFRDEVRKGRWNLDKILVPWDVCVYEVGQEVVSEVSKHDPGVSWFSTFYGGWLGLMLCWWQYGR